jgi:hypothetical protein
MNKYPIMEYAHKNFKTIETCKKRCGLISCMKNEFITNHIELIEGKLKQ